MSLSAVYSMTAHGAPFTFDDGVTYLATSSKLDTADKQELLDLKVKNEPYACMIVKNYLDAGMVPHVRPVIPTIPAPTYSMAAATPPAPPPQPRQPMYTFDPATGGFMPIHPSS
jgi:hypothetical protein